MALQIAICKEKGINFTYGNLYVKFKPSNLHIENYVSVDCRSAYTAAFWQPDAGLSMLPTAKALHKSSVSTIKSMG